MERVCTVPCIPSSRDPSHTGDMLRALQVWQLACVCPTVLFATSLWKTPPGTRCGKTSKDKPTVKGKIASFDDEVFLTQTTCIYIMFKPKSQIKMNLELTSCKGGQEGFWTFCVSAELPYLHGLCCTGEAEGSRGQAQPESTGKHSSTFEQVRACKCTKHLDTLF